MTLQSSVVPSPRSLSEAAPVNPTARTVAQFDFSIDFSEFPCLSCHSVWAPLDLARLLWWATNQLIKLYDPSFPVA